MPDMQPPHPAERTADLVTRIKPPHSLEAEQEILAAVFLDPNAIEILAARLAAADLYLERHQRLYAGMLALHRRSSVIDVVTLGQEMRDRGEFDRIGGARGITELLDRAGTVAHIPHYIGIVLEKATRRRVLLAAQALEVAAHSYADGDLERAIADVEEAKLARIETLTPTESWSVATHENAAVVDPSAPPRRIVSSGIGPLDEHLPSGGFEGGWLVIGMSPPGGGKTTYAFGNVARPVCEAGGSVLYVALSDAGVRRLNLKMMAGVSGVPERAAKRRDMTPNQLQDWAAAADNIASWKLRIERLRSVRDIALCARTISRRMGLDLIVVDYIQRVRNGQRDGWQDIAETTGTLQDLALELDVPVLALSQPSTDARRSGKVIKASDAKGGGSIEEDADLVLSLLRGETDRRAAGLAILKGRDVMPRLWAAEDGTANGRMQSACGWKWDIRSMRLEVSP